MNSIARLFILSFGLAVGVSAHANTILINSDTTDSYLDITIDLSDGTFVSGAGGDGQFFQNNGIYNQVLNASGWTISQVVSVGGFGGGLTLRAGSDFDNRGYYWLPDWSFWTAGVYNPDYGYGPGYKAFGSWDGATPTLTYLDQGPSRLVANITWNVPDTGSTIALFGLAMITLFASTGRFRRAASDVNARSGSNQPR